VVLEQIVTVVTWSIRTFMTSNFILKILLSVGLNQLWSMCNALQLIYLIPFIGIRMRSHEYELYGLLIEVASFDILSGLELSENWFSYQSIDPYDEIFGQNGYDTCSFVKNQSLFYVTFWILIFVYTIHALARKCVKKTSWRVTKRWRRFIDRTLWWSPLLRFYIESYMDCLVNVILNVSMFKYFKENGVKGGDI